MDPLTDVSMFWFCFWLYLGAFLLFTVYLAFRHEVLGRIAAGTMLLGFVPHTAGIVMRWEAAGHVPFANMFEYANLMSWMTVATFGGIAVRYRQLILGTIVAPAVVVIVVSASMLPKDASSQLVPALQSYWLAIHVVLAALAEGAFAVAMAVSVAYLLRRRAEARRETKRFWRRFPSLETLDEVNYRAVTLGYPLFTVGALFAGSIWAHEAWGTFWAWDPKEVGAAVIWLFYTGHLHARYQRGWEGPRAAWLSVVGFAFILLSFAGNLFLGGQHAYG